jgi:MYXO-CTERM domain-containing protein
VRTATLAASVLFTACGPAFAVDNATNYPLYELNGALTPLGGYTGRTPVGVSYSVFTGLATGAGGLVQIDTATAGGDLRVFGGAPSLINPYVTVAGTSLSGQSRLVTDLAVANGFGGFDLTITITGALTPPGTSANLFPSGLTSGGNALTGAGVGLGLNLGARGNSPLAFPENFVQSATLTLMRAGGTTSVFNLAPAVFFGAPGGWTGAVGVSISNIAVAANEADPFTSVIWNISTSNVPAPAGTALLGLGLFAAGRRRRS